jgi:transglutaminase-like putative cysteine protease
MIFRLVILLPVTAYAYVLLSAAPQAANPLLQTCWVMLLLAAAMLGFCWNRHHDPPTPRAANRRPPDGLYFASLTAVVLAIASGFLWLLSAAPKPLEALAITLEHHLRPQAAAARHAADPTPNREGNGLWDDQRRRTLPKRTNFTLANRPEIFLRLRDPGDAAELLQGQIYVRAFALGKYEHAAWSTLAETPQLLLADAAGLVHLENRPGRAIVHEVFHSSNANGQNVLTAIQGAVAAELPELTRLDTGLYLLPPSPKPAGYEYVASSVPLRLENLPDGVAISAWKNAPAVLTELPEMGSFTPRLRELATVAAGTGTLPQRLLNLQNHLRTTLKYSLESTNPRDLDPIENFLFAEQRGHCEYFATAGALLARALGVPARAAYGWAGGTYYEDSNLFVFRAREAHAWTEVCLEGYGWVVLDPTPPVALTGDHSRVAAPGENPPGSATTNDKPPPDDPPPSSKASAAALWLILASSLPALGLLLWRGSRQQRANQGAPDARATAVATPNYLTSWRRAAAGRGVPMPAGMTLRQHLGRLSAEVEFRDELLTYHYATRYEGQPPDARREKQLLAKIRSWEHRSV